MFTYLIVPTCLKFLLVSSYCSSRRLSWLRWFFAVLCISFVLWHLTERKLMNFWELNSVDPNSILFWRPWALVEIFIYQCRSMARNIFFRYLVNFVKLNQFSSRTQWLQIERGVINLLRCTISTKYNKSWGKIFGLLLCMMSNRKYSRISKALMASLTSKQFSSVAIYLSVQIKILSLIKSLYIHSNVISLRTRNCNQLHYSSSFRAKCCHR